MKKTEIVANVLADYLPMANPDTLSEISKRILMSLKLAKKQRPQTDVSEAPVPLHS